MKITVSQQPVFASIKENLECTIDVLDTHKDSDWILTPEGSLSGYCANVCHEGTTQQKQELVNTVGLPLGMNAWGYSTDVLKSVLIKNDMNVLETGWGRPGHLCAAPVHRRLTRETFCVLWCQWR